MANSKRKAMRPNATGWDKVAARDDIETLGNRDVHSNQQLDRGQLEKRRTKTEAMIVGWVLTIFITIFVWLFWSFGAFALAGLSPTGGSSSSATYYQESVRTGTKGQLVTCYQGLTESGMPEGECFPDVSQVPVPQWYTTSQAQNQTTPKTERQQLTSMGESVMQITWMKVWFSVGAGAGIGLLVGTWLARRVDVANAMSDTSDINQYHGDQHIALPEEIQRKFDWFPDAGAHSDVQVSSMISHMMLKQKGLGKVNLTVRAETDVIDEQGNLLYYAGEPMLDNNGVPRSTTVPMIDEEFGEALFEASGLPDNPALRKTYDTSVIPYNPGNRDRDKLPGHDTVAKLINHDWELPDYEVQRPGGAYMVDTAPVNTMVLAITRAGKGQTYIEPMLDMWSREKRPSNMVINDPKGELLVKNYIPFTTRGFEPIQFNLINAMKTDIYNPLGMAADAAREGDATKCAIYVENIADVFFPVDGGDDPVWPNAANNAFKRAAYGLIDFYLEEERQLRETAEATNMDPTILESKLDEMWGQVTLYNCYQLFVQLTAKKIKNPEAELERKAKAGEYEEDPEGFADAKLSAERQAFLWEGKAEQDMLTLYFNATEALPLNTMRTLIANANNALRAMAGAEKMLASVYGIAITAMSFFTDPTISTLTSGRPSQNTDLGGLSFPRRVGVRFVPGYLKRDHLIGKQVLWTAYGDAAFSQALGKDFDHSDIISREGWARYYFKGIFPTDEAWIKLEILDPQTKVLIRTMHFHFRKGYQVSLNGRHFVIEPVTGKKIVKGGVLREVHLDYAKGVVTGSHFADTTFKQKRLDLNVVGSPELVKVNSRAIGQTMVRYSEAPKAVFLVTPPHLMKYARLILILIKQLVDLNFDKSYMTKSNQKPLYKTRFMLDELGNLQSDGHGISGFETMLSIGLGQEQQFTLILQTLQQLRDVYGESVDKIVQGNAQPLDAKIATPAGWTTMGQIKVGDEVLVPEGGTALIDGVFPRGVRQVYRVTRADGSSTRVCNEHLWEIEIED